MRRESWSSPGRAAATAAENRKKPIATQASSLFAGGIPGLSGGLTEGIQWVLGAVLVLFNITVYFFIWYSRRSHGA